MKIRMMKSFLFPPQKRRESWNENIGGVTQRKGGWVDNASSSECSGKETSESEILRLATAFCSCGKKCVGVARSMEQ